MPHGRVPRALLARARPLIGVIHLPPLPGYPESPGLAAVVAHALAELATYRVGGLDGVLVENEHDRPHRVEAGRETIAVMTAVTRALVAAADRPARRHRDPAQRPGGLARRRTRLGRRLHPHRLLRRRDEPPGARRDAHRAGEVIAYRARIGAERVLVLADIQVKYAQMIAPRTLGESARDGVRGGRRRDRRHGHAHGRGALAAGRAGRARGRRRLPGARRQRPRARAMRASCWRSPTARSWARA